MNRCGTTHQKHIDEWVEGSGVSEEIAVLNIESISAEEANKRVKPKHPIKDPGWWCRGVNWRTGKHLSERHGQFKPNHPHYDPEKGSDAKYLTASRMTPDVMFLKMPRNNNYWQNIYDSLSNPVFWTEGAKKAGAGLSIDLPTIALAGVWNWIKKGKPATEVLNWIKRGGIQYLCFDSDYREKPHCREAIRRFCTLAREHGTELRIVSWDSQWKGMDDFIKANGKDAFLDAIKMAQTLEQWEQQFKKEGTRAGKPTPQAIAKEIAKKYQPTWRFSDKEQVWRFWNGKYWEKKSDSYIETSVKAILDSREVEYKNLSFINNTVGLLKLDLTTFKWETFDRAKYIAFDNGVLEVETKKLLPHQPGYGLTSVLPYKYNPLKPVEEHHSVIEALKTECPTTFQFMATTMKGDEVGIKKLLAVINSVITFKLSKLQMFVHFCGLPGTGKGTMTRLIQKCVGKNNYKGSNIKSLSKPDEIANIIDKQLVILPDERTDTTVDAILGLTGNDEMSYRQLFKEGASGIFHGSIVVSSNTPLFAGHTIGLDRRTCMISFNNTIPDDKRDGNIEGLMDNEIAQLIAVSLMLSDTEVTTLIRGIGDANVPSFKLHQWRLKLESDSVASFFNEMIVVDPNGSISGNDLYKEAYKDYCNENGLKALANNKFPERLNELLRVIGVTVEKRSRANRVTWHGIRLRRESEETLTYEEQLEEEVKQSEQDKQKAKGNTRSDTNSVPDDVPAQSQTEKASSPATPASEVNNTKINSEPTKPDDFQVGDRVIEVYPKKIGDIKHFGTVVEVEKPQGAKGIYTVEWENTNPIIRTDVYSHEIEHYQR